VWSLAFRRRAGDLSPLQRTCRFLLDELIRLRHAILIGPVRQEVLSGITNEEQFERLRSHLRSFDDEPVSTEDFEEAARCRNRCISMGIAASAIDMVLCAVAIRLAVPIFTVDPDFQRYAAHLRIRVPAPSEIQTQLTAERAKYRRRY